MVWRDRLWTHHQCRSHCLRWRSASHCILETARCCWWGLQHHPQISEEDRCKPANTNTINAQALQWQQQQYTKKTGLSPLHYLDFVFRIISTAIHIEASVHSAAQVTPLRNRANRGYPDQGSIMHTATVQTPFCWGLNGVRPKLEHSSCDQPQ